LPVNVAPRSSEGRASSLARKTLIDNSVSKWRFI
jgi:hypothetical protein